MDRLDVALALQLLAFQAAYLDMLTGRLARLGHELNGATWSFALCIIETRVTHPRLYQPQIYALASQLSCVSIADWYCARLVGITRMTSCDSSYHMSQCQIRSPGPWVQNRRYTHVHHYALRKWCVLQSHPWVIRARCCIKPEISQS